MKQATNTCQIKNADKFQPQLVFSWQLDHSPEYLRVANKFAKEKKVDVTS